MSQGTPAGKRLEARGKSFAIVAARWNAQIVDALVAGATAALRESGAEVALVARCAGVFELAPLCARVARQGAGVAGFAGDGRSPKGAAPIDGIIALGCLIRGGTDHYSLLAGETTRALGSLALELATSLRPVALAFGVLTCDTEAQAEERKDKGREAALACIEQSIALEAVG